MIRVLLLGLAGLITVIVLLSFLASRVHRFLAELALDGATSEREELLIAAMRNRVQVEVMNESVDRDCVHLATEHDAREWGFPTDWMAAERVELFWANRKGQA